MSWETMQVQTTRQALGDNEVSVNQTKIRNSYIFRITMRKSVFPEGTEKVVLKYDLKKNKLGFFKSTNGDEGTRKLSVFNKNLCSVTCPKILGQMGFEKKRYKIYKSEDDKEMYFYIKAKKKKDEIKKDPPA